MITVTIDDAGLSRRLNVDLMPAVRTAAVVIGEELRSHLAVYPGPASHPIKWASERQKRFYFAMRRERGLPFGYTRNSDPMSQRLGPSWTVARTQSGASVGTRASYAPWVQSSEKQSAQMKATGWITDQQAVEAVQRSGMIKQAVLQAIVAQLKMRS